MKNEKQPRGPSMGEWLNKPWYVPTMEYYSALKRNILTHAVNSLKLWGTVLSEMKKKKKSQSWKVTYMWSYLYSIFEMMKVWKWRTDEWLQKSGVRCRVGVLLLFSGEGNGNPLQCSCLENPRDGGAWWAAVYGVAQSRTRLKRCSSSH